MMKYFVNLKNMNKYCAATKQSIEFLEHLGYLEVTKVEYEELEDIF